MELKYTVQGFWTSPDYSSYVLSLMKDYSDSFGNARLLELALKEEINPTGNNSDVHIADDGSYVKVDVIIPRFFLHDNSLFALPTPADALQEIRFRLDKAETKYREKFMLK